MNALRAFDRFDAGDGTGFAELEAAVAELYHHVELGVPDVLVAWEHLQGDPKAYDALAAAFEALRTAVAATLPESPATSHAPVSRGAA